MKNESMSFRPEGVAERELSLEALDAFAQREIGEMLKKQETLLAKSASEKQGKKVRHVIARCLRAVRFALLASAVGLGINYERTRYEVSTTQDEHGETEYTHNDPETTAILDYYSSKRDLPHEQKLKIIIKRFSKSLQSHSTTKVDLENINEDDLREKLKLIVKDDFGLTLDLQHNDWVDWLVPPPLSFNKKLYKALWKIEQSVGNPRIRFDDTFPVEHYSVLENTIYTFSPWTKENSVDGIVAEMAHAKQFEKAPIASSIKVVAGGMRTLERLPSSEDLLDAYLPEYDMPGSLEHEAHKKIEPELIRKIYKDMQE